MELFIGAILSVLVQFVKKYIPESLRALFTIVLALIAGAVIYYSKQNVALLETATAIFAYASAFYLAIIKQIERITK